MPYFIVFNVHVNSEREQQCEGGDLCYVEITTIQNFLNQQSIRDQLGVESPRNFSSCANDVGKGFGEHMDKYGVPTQYHVAGLLERGIRMLIYAGTYDWQCNWVANKLWVEKLEWTGSGLFQDEEWRGWSVLQDANLDQSASDKKDAGITKTGGLLTFATIYGAGHMMSTFPFCILSRMDLANNCFCAWLRPA